MKISWRFSCTMDIRDWNARRVFVYCCIHEVYFSLTGVCSSVYCSAYLPGETQLCPAHCQHECCWPRGSIENLERSVQRQEYRPATVREVWESCYLDTRAWLACKNTVGKGASDVPSFQRLMRYNQVRRRLLCHVRNDAVFTKGTCWRLAFYKLLHCRMSTRYVSVRISSRCFKVIRQKPWTQLLRWYGNSAVCTKTR